MRVTFPGCQQQNGFLDCGLFAIARLFDWALGNFDLRNKVYDQTKMRRHFAKCLLNNTLEAFPEREMANDVIKTNDCYEYLYLACNCSLPICYGRTGNTFCQICQKIFHLRCLGLKNAEKYICPSCVQNVRQNHPLPNLF